MENIENLSETAELNTPTEEVADAAPVEDVEELKITTEEVDPVDSFDPSKPLIDEDDDEPLNDMNMKQIEELLRTMSAMVDTLKKQWMDDATKFGIVDAHMRKLATFNYEKRQPMPEGLTEEERNEWDHLNGIDQLTPEEVIEVFGEGHPLIHSDHSITIANVKEVCHDFFAWTSSVREYRNVHDAYIQLLEQQEEDQVELLRATAQANPDPEARERMLASCDNYYNLKYLKFLINDHTEEDIQRISKGLYDKKKIEYWLTRSRDKLRRLKISELFIFEIAQFEKRFLEEKYWGNSNVLLCYFMNLCAYSNVDDPKEMSRVKSICMVTALDAIIRKQWDDVKAAPVLDAIRQFEDRFLESVAAEAAAHADETNAMEDVINATMKPNNDNTSTHAPADESAATE